MGRSKRRAANTSLDSPGDDSGRTSRSKRAKVDEASRRESGEGTPGKLMVRCTTCSQQVVTTNPDSIHQHPFLNVLICKKCLIYFRSGEITQDEDGLDEQCRWCGDGGKLYGCDHCHNAFCKRCILRNFGRPEMASVEGKDGDENHKWKCYVCAPEKLQDLRTTCEEVMALQEQRREEAERRKEELKRQREEQEKVRAERHEEKMQREMDRRRSHGNRTSNKKAKQVSFPSDFCLNPDILLQLHARLLSANSDFSTCLMELGKEMETTESPSTSKSEEKPEKMEVEGEEAEAKKEEDAGKEGGEASTEEGEKKAEEQSEGGKTEDAKMEVKAESLSGEALERRQLELTMKMEQGLTAFLRSVNEMLKIVPAKPKKKVSTPSTPASSTPSRSAEKAEDQEEEEKEEEEDKDILAKDTSENVLAVSFDDDDEDEDMKDEPPKDEISASEKFDLMMKKSQEKKVSEKNSPEKKSSPEKKGTPEKKESPEKKDNPEKKGTPEKDSAEKKETTEEPMDVGETNDKAPNPDSGNPAMDKQDEEPAAQVTEKPAETVKPQAEEKLPGSGDAPKVSQDSSERNGQHTDEPAKPKDPSLGESPVKKVPHDDPNLCTSESDKPNGTDTPLVGVTTN